MLGEAEGRREMARLSMRLYKSTQISSTKYVELLIISDSGAKECENVRNRVNFAGSRLHKRGAT